MSLVYRTVSVAGRPPIEVCLSPEAGDDIAPWLAEHDWIDEPPQHAFLEQINPGSRVLDLGAHVGLYALTAAALGAKVIAVEAMGGHAERLALAAERNGFVDLAVVHGVLAERSGRRLRWAGGSMMAFDALVEDDSSDLVTVAVDDLLDANGWDGVDLVKMDIEGSELAALGGMRRLFARGARPLFMFEANAAALPRHAADLAPLRSFFTRRGYRLLQIDYLRPGLLVEPQRLQPEAVADYLALPEGHEVPQGWELAPPLTREEFVSRFLDEAAIDSVGYRRYGAQVLARAPAWLAQDPLVHPAHRALVEDVEPRVRELMGPAPKGVAKVREQPADPRLVVLARQVAVGARRERLARVVGQPRKRPPRLLLDDVSFYVRRGTMVGIVGSGIDERRALMEALAGRRAPVSGDLRVSGRPLLLGRLTEVLEPELTLAENIAVLSAYLGRSVHDAAEPVHRLRVGHALDIALSEFTADTIVCLVLMFALEAPTHDLLLLDGIPPPREPGVRKWVSARTHALRGEGVTIVQAAETSEGLLGPPDRLLYLRDHTLLAAGHVGSVSDLQQRDRLNLPDRVATGRRSWTRLAS